MTAKELQTKIESLKENQGLTTKQALDWIKEESIPPEKLAEMQEELRKQVENPNLTWDTFNASSVFKS